MGGGVEGVLQLFGGQWGELGGRGGSEAHWGAVGRTGGNGGVLRQFGGGQWGGMGGS